MAEIVDETKTLVITLTSPSAIISCTSATPHYSSGCALLLAYDRDNDGVISMSELFAATDDAEAGIITASEAKFVSDAYTAGVIDALCTGCYTPPYVPPPTNGGDPSSSPTPKSLAAGDHNITISKSNYETVVAKINVSSKGEVTCESVTGVSGCGTGYPRVEASGTSVKVYMAQTEVVSDVCAWITGLGGWKSIQWTPHVLEAYYVYIGATGHSVGFSPVTWDDVLGLYYYYINQSINDPSAGNAKTGCGFT